MHTQKGRTKKRDPGTAAAPFRQARHASGAPDFESSLRTFL
jgi:hypothetical protein